MIACQVVRNISVLALDSCHVAVCLTEFLLLPALPMMAYQVDSEDTYEKLAGLTTARALLRGSFLSAIQPWPKHCANNPRL